MTERHYSNHELASIFQKIADLLEIKGELIYKILAYRKAADSLENLGMDASALRQQGKLTEIPGVGKAIAEKIDELFSTGSLEFLVKLEAEVPPTLVDLLAGARPGTQENRPVLEAAGRHRPGRAGSRRPGRQAAEPARHGRKIRSSASSPGWRRSPAAPTACRSAKPGPSPSRPWRCCGPCPASRPLKPPAACAACARPSATSTSWLPPPTPPP